MFVVDDSIKSSPGLDELTRKILNTTGFRGLRGEDGREFFGYPHEQGTWMIVEPTGGVCAGAAEKAWVAGRVDQYGRGFRLGEPLDLHNAVIGTFRMPSPIYSRGLDQEVADEVVMDWQHANIVLTERLTADLELAPGMHH